MSLIGELWNNEYDDGIGRGLVLFLGAILLLVLACIPACVREGMTERECLRRGYPNASITWGGYGTPYCIKRLDQTDVVVPL